MADPAASPGSAFKRFMKRWGFALFIPIVAFLFRDVLLPFVFAIVVAYILAPVVNRLARVQAGRGTMPRGLAVLLCYVVFIGSLVAFMALFLPRLSGDVARLAREGPGLLHKVDKEWTPQLAGWLEKRFPSLAPEPLPEPPVDVIVGEPPPPPGTVVTLTPLPSGDFAVVLQENGVELDRVDEHRVVLRPRVEDEQLKLEDQLRSRFARFVASLEDQAGDLLRFGQAVVAGIVTVLMKLVLVLMVAAFILIDLDKLHLFARGVIPVRYRHEYEEIVAGIDRGLNGVIRGQLIICLVNGVLTFIGLVLFEVKYALLLSVIAAVMSLIPIFGSILSTIPIVAMALVSTEQGIDFVKGAFALGWILLIHFIEANFLNPKIIGTAAKMHPVLVIFALIAGESTYGLVGALFAVPVASIIQTLFVYFRRQAWKTDASLAGDSGSLPAVPPVDRG